MYSNSLDADSSLTTSRLGEVLNERRKSFDEWIAFPSLSNVCRANHCSFEDSRNDRSADAAAVRYCSSDASTVR